VQRARHAGAAYRLTPARCSAGPARNRHRRVPRRSGDSRRSPTHGR